jgi:O-methyltransferase involved in polyketide biosynthesis
VKRAEPSNLERERHNETPQTVQTLEAKDLSVTALYTAQVWSWAGFKGAHHFSTKQTQGVFNATNGALAIMRMFRWGLPRLPEGLAQRHTLIDQLTEERSPAVVIELAAGLSSRAIRLCTRHPETITRYVEVDLTHVIDFKRVAYERSGATPQALTCSALDLKMLTPQQLSDWLTCAELNNSEERPRSAPVIIAEGLLMYLNPDEAGELLRVIAQGLSGSGGRLIFDWVPTVEQPPPGMFGRLLGALMRLFTGGQSFQRDTRTRREMLAQLTALGATATAIDTHQVAGERELPFPQANTQQLVFCVDWPVSTSN